MQKIDYDEIPSTIIKLLCEKPVEKKNLGIRELENFMRQVVDFKYDESICNFIKVVKEQLYEQGGSTNNAALRRASFWAFVAISNTLRMHEISNTSCDYLLIQPLLSSFKESDSKMIVEATHSLIKILKSQNKVVLKYFSDLFEGLLILNVHPDQEVRNAANSLDDLLKEIMNNSLQAIELIRTEDFNIQNLYQKLFEKMRANHPAIKILIVSWITFLDSIPDLKLIEFLPDLLPGLFSMLCDKTKDVYQSVDKCLKHFLQEIEAQFERLTLFSNEVINKVLEILINQCKSSYEAARLRAFEWLFMFLQKYHSILSGVYDKSFKIQSRYYSKLRSIGNLPASKSFYQSTATNPGRSSFLDDNSSQNNFYLQPEFSFKPDRINLNKEIEGDENSPDKNKGKSAGGCNLVSKIPFHLFHRMLDSILFNVNSQNELILSLSHSCNATLVKMIDYFSLDINSLDVKNFEEVLKNYFDSKKESTIDLILNWISKLFKKFHDEMFNKIEVFIDNFTDLLTDSNENIFNTILDILCELSKYKEEYIELILCKILEKLCHNKNLLNSKGLVILKKLCSFLPAATVLTKFADVLLKVKDYEFISNMVNILDIFLLTHKETEYLRLTMLKNFKKKSNEMLHEEAKKFFEKLYPAWCFNPVSLLILCILCENFELSYHLILKFADLKLEQEYLIQLSQLVQLMESSLFNSIRTLMLEPVKNFFLIKTLYGILMLLPQGKAFNSLSKRLKSVEILLQLDQGCEHADTESAQEELERYLETFLKTQIMCKQKNKNNLVVNI